MTSNLTAQFPSPFDGDPYNLSPLTIFILTCLSTYVAKKVVWSSVKGFNVSKLKRVLEGTGCGMFMGSPEVVMSTLMRHLEKAEPTPYTFWLVHLRYVLVGNPEDLQIVFNSSQSLEKSLMYKFFINTVGEGLFSAPIEKWKKHRRIITPAFNMRLIENFFPIFNGKNENLISKFQMQADNGIEFDVYDLISFNALDIICQTMLGYDINALESEKIEFETALKTVSVADSMRIYKPWLHPDIIFKLYTKYTGLDRSYRNLHKLPERIIKQKQEILKTKKQAMDNEGNAESVAERKFKSFLDIMLELNEAGAEFSDVDIRDEVVTMMIGGSETSAVTLSTTLLMLAMNPEIQEKVYQELISVLGSENHPISMDDVNEMPFLEQCIREALRLFPPGPVILRRATSNITLNNNFVIPAGANIVISPLKTQRHPNTYNNPLEYNPENFSPEQMKKRHKFSFVAFSGGPRGCIGSKYAMLSMKVTLAKIIHNYQLTTTVKYNEIKLKLDLLMRITTGYKIEVHSRKYM